MRPATATATTPLQAGEVTRRPSGVLGRWKPSASRSRAGDHEVRPGARCWTRSLQEPCVYCPGETKMVQVQCPAVKCYRKVWSRKVCEKQVECVKDVRETCVKRSPTPSARWWPSSA